MKRIVGLLFAFLLMSQTIISGLGVNGQLLSEGAERSVFTDVTVEQQTEDSTDVQVHVSWSVKELNISKEDVETIDLPENVTIEAEQTSKLTSGDAEVGTYTAATNGQVRVEFNEEIENNQEAEGVFSVDAVVEVEEPEEESVEEDVKAGEENGQASETTDEEEQVQGKEDDRHNDDEKELGKKSNALDGKRSIQTKREPITIEENIIKDGSLTLTKADGTLVNADEVTDLKEGLQLEFDWELPNGHSYIAGDTFELQLPEQFEGVPIPNGSLGEYGSFTVDENGLVTFTFTEEIEKQSNISGHFSMNVELDEKKITKTEDVLEFKVNDEVVEKIAVKFKPTGGKAIQKNGKHADNRKFNTEAIDWTVHLNTTLESLTNAQVKDVINKNQELDLDSIELYEVEVNIKGEIIGVKDELVDLSRINQLRTN